MKAAKLALLSLLALTFCFASCNKDKIDKRIYGRWKITGYYLDGVSAYDTIEKYFHGYEYEIIEVDGKGSQSQCGCNAVIKKHDENGTGLSEITEITETALSTDAFRSFRVPPPSCDSNASSILCWGFPNGWRYVLQNDQQMEWKLEGTPPPPQHSHTLIFTKIS